MQLIKKLPVSHPCIQTRFLLPVSRRPRGSRDDYWTSPENLSSVRISWLFRHHASLFHRLPSIIDRRNGAGTSSSRRKKSSSDLSPNLKRKKVTKTPERSAADLNWRPFAQESSVYAPGLFVSWRLQVEKSRSNHFGPDSHGLAVRALYRSPHRENAFVHHFSTRRTSQW